jgi:hypothetical protein
LGTGNKKPRLGGRGFKVSSNSRRSSLPVALQRGRGRLLCAASDSPSNRRQAVWKCLQKSGRDLDCGRLTTCPETNAGQVMGRFGGPTTRSSARPGVAPEITRQRASAGRCDRSGDRLKKSASPFVVGGSPFDQAAGPLIRRMSELRDRLIMICHAGGRLRHDRLGAYRHSANESVPLAGGGRHKITSVR